MKVWISALLLLLSFLPLSALAATITLPQTGQTKCYDPSGNTPNEIPCAGTGQDGDKQMGATWPNPRFTDNGNGTVTDNLTGLIWLKNATCFGTKVWADALTAANTLASGACNLSDGSQAGQWRLPNIKEMQSLIDRGRTQPGLPAGHPFTGVQPGNYWSSSTYVYYSSYAWYLSIGSGGKYSVNKSNLHNVWPVRGGQ